MRMLVAGASGFVGGRLLAEAALEGVETTVLQRPDSGSGILKGSPESFLWNPATGSIDPLCLQNVDTIVNLCGAGIADARWTPARKRILRESRILSTRTLVGALERVGGGGRVLLNASAVGIYGDRAEACLPEGAQMGEGFLAELCAEWEAEALEARRHGVRVVLLRIGVVLGEGGGILSKMGPAFRLGLGAVLGDGRAWMSWISQEDLVRAIVFIASRPSISGAVNMVAPDPLRNREFSSVLTAAYGRKSRLRIPAWALRLALGDMAREALLGSSRVLPTRLQEEGFVYRDREISSLLQSLIDK